MQRKTTFTSAEAETIRALIRQKCNADRSTQKSFRDKMRNLGFYISDFTSNLDGFTVEDFEALIKDKQIMIDGTEAPSTQPSSTITDLNHESDSSGMIEGLASLKQQGFEGFKKVSELMETRCAEVPAVQGVYVILRESADEPVFLEEGTGGAFKGKNPNSPIRMLQVSWVEDTQILYIGMTRDSLKRRLNAYMRFGQGQPVGHWGGRFIWQLEDSSDLVVCWKPMPKGNAAKEESEMIQAFKQAHAGRRPFANLRD